MKLNFPSFSVVYICAFQVYLCEEHCAELEEIEDLTRLE